MGFWGLVKIPFVTPGKSQKNAKGYLAKTSYSYKCNLPPREVVENNKLGRFPRTLATLVAPVQKVVFDELVSAPQKLTDRHATRSQISPATWS